MHLTPNQARAAKTIISAELGEGLAPHRVEELEHADVGLDVILEQAAERGSADDEVVAGLEAELPDDMLQLALDHVASLEDA